MTRRRFVIGLLGALVLAGIASALARDDDRFLLKAQFKDASGLREGFFVKMGGVPVGRVTEVDLDDNDVAVVSMRVDRGATPIGRDARAAVRPSSLLGEHHVELTRGDGTAIDEGTTLPLARTSTATELDQVLAAFDEPTRQALGVFLTEAGAALLGRGEDLATALERLPPTLEQSTELLRDLGHDNHALARLIDSSDRVVAPLARERHSLGRLIATADRALLPLARRRGELGASIEGSPRSLIQLRRTFRRLRSLSRAIAPAADGLRLSAAPLQATLEGLGPFADAALPSLRELRRAAPYLRGLAETAEPTVVSLRPVVGRLAETARTFEPTSQMLDRRGNDLFAFLEGYARAMHRSDSLGHIYNTQTVFQNLSGAARAMRDDRTRRREPEGSGRDDRKAPEERRDGGDAKPAGRPEDALPRIPGLTDKPLLPGAPSTPPLPRLPDVKPPDVAPGAPLPEHKSDLADFLLGP